MTSVSPNVSILLNFLFGLAGLAESTGLTNIVTTSGGKAGAIAATVFAGVNMLLHSISSSDSGPLAPSAK